MDYLSRPQNSRTSPSFQVQDRIRTIRKRSHSFILSPYFLLYALCSGSFATWAIWAVRGQRAPVEAKKCDHNQNSELKDSACEEFAKIP